MINKGYNKELYNIRIEKGLSIKEASKQLHVSSLTLSLIEKGYLKVSKKKENNFISFYGLESTFFDDLLYPVALNEEKPKAKKVDELKQMVYYSFIGILVAVSCVFIPLSAALAATASKHIYSQYEKDVRRFSEDIIEKGEKIDDDKYQLCYTELLDKSDDSSNADTTTNDIKIDVTFQSYSDLDKLMFYKATAHYSENDINSVVTFNIKNNNFFVSLFYNVDSDDGYNIEYTFKKGYDKEIKIAKYTVFDKEFNQIKEDESVINTYINNVKRIPEQSELAINKAIGGYNLRGITYAIIEYSKHYNGFKTAWSILLVVFSFVGAISTSLIICRIIKDVQIKNENKKVKKSKDEKIIAYNTSDASIVHISASTHEGILAQNMRFTPFIPETLINILVMLLMVVMATGMVFLSTFLYSFQVTHQVNSTVVFTNQNEVNSLFEIVSIAVVVSVILDLFTRVDKQISSNKYFSSNAILFTLAFAFFATSCGYVGAVSFCTSDFPSFISKIQKYVLPNIFIALFAFSSLSMFLFAKPKFKKNEQIKTLMFRSLSVLPILYFIVSIIFSYVIKPESINEFPMFLTYLLFYQKAPYVLFGLVYYLALYIYRKVNMNKDIKNNVSIYFSGNKYNMIKNLIACVILIGLYTLFILLSLTTKNVKLVSDFSIGYNKLIPLISILMLFYKSHIGSRNKKSDILYDITYILPFLSFIAFMAMTIPICKYIDVIQQAIV